MKPTIRSTAVAFLIVGAAALVLGVTGLPKPTVLVSGAAASLAGIGMYLRMRRAWTLGIVYALASCALSGWRLYRAIVDGDGLVSAIAWMAVDAYLLVSVLAIRAHFADKK